MASINTIVKRKQYLWLGIVVVGTASAIGGALYLSDVDMSGNGETVAEQEPVPDMTGVVDKQAERFNAITRAYYMNAAATQFPLPEGMNLPLTLRH